MSFREVLELFVRADVQGAVTDLNRLGVEAERNLDKSSQASERLANRFIYTGAAMVGGAAVIGYGLLQLVDRFSEAERAGLLMDNTLQKMPELAGANRAAFDDLASSIMKKTAVDDDAILTAEALLGTFHLTADEIKKATPLVVDYARKFGVDLNSAAVQVGKAFEGNIGTLQRNGIIIDENRYATDRFGAVIQALRENAGGFAEAEGATFEGRLARVKNEMGNLAENAGGGVVNALDKLLGAVEPVAAGMGDLDAATGGALGETATWGTIAVGAVGGLLVLAGGVMKLKNYVGDLSDTFPRATSAVQTFAGPAGMLTGIFGAAAIAGMSLHQVIDDTSDAWSTATAELERYNDKQLRANAAITFAHGGFDGYLDRVREVAKESPVTAQRMVDLGNFGAAARKKLEAAIEDEKKATLRANDVQQRNVDLLKSQAEGNEELVDAINSQIDAQLRQFSTELQALDANDRYRTALDEYAEKARVAAEAGGDNALANADASIAMRDAEQSALQLAAANAADAEAKAKAAGVTDTASVKNQAFRDTLVFLSGTLAPGSPLQVYLQDAINRLDAAGKDRHSTVTADGQQAVDEANRVATAWEGAAERIKTAFAGAKASIDAVGAGAGGSFLDGRGP